MISAFPSGEKQQMLIGVWGFCVGLKRMKVSRECLDSMCCKSQSVGDQKVDQCMFSTYACQYGNSAKPVSH